MYVFSQCYTAIYHTSFLEELKLSFQFFSELRLSRDYPFFSFFGDLNGERSAE